MEALDQNLIERYWANEMSSTERQHFEQRLALEPGLLQDFEEYKLVMDALKLAERKELLQRFRQRDKILDKKNRGNLSVRTRNLWIISAAASILAIFIGWKFFMSPVQTPNMANNLPKDTITNEQKLPINMDTPPVKEPKIDKKKEHKETKPKASGEVLYAANFETYKDESMNPTSRGDEDELTAFEKFQLYYWEEKNAEALEEFKKMTLPQQNNPNLLFFQAIALMAVDSLDEAKSILLDIEKDQKLKYKTEVIYYLALLDIKSGNNEAARKKLVNYLNTQEPQHKSNAQKILAELD